MKMAYGNPTILIVGDLHLRKTKPEMRLDDYFEAMQRKVDFIFDMAMRNKVQFIIFPGDIFDRPDAPHGLVEWAIRMFKRDLPFEFLFVYGQHDLRYHTSDKQNSPLGVLVAALEGRARVLTPEATYFAAYHKLGLSFWGCSWGDEIPPDLGDGINADADIVKILVLHRLIMREKAHWAEDDPKVLTTKELYRTCNADVFICGDNHEKFTVSARGRRIINMGSVMRSNTKQVDHEPALGLLRVGGDKKIDFEEILIPIEQGVFDMEKVEEKQEQEERTSRFVEGLQQDFDPELSFKENIRVAAEQAPKGVQSILQECLE